jgi:hypothetical protein
MTDANDLGTVVSNADLKATRAGKEVFAANDVRTLIANNLRSLICRCVACQHAVDLRVYTEYATLARISSNLVRFRCPHCSVEHETKMGAVCPEVLLIERHQAKRTRHQHAAQW